MACREVLAIHLGLYLALIIVCGLVAGTSEAVAVGAPSQVDGEVKSPDMDEVTRLIMEGTNRFRKQEGRGELKSQPQLVATARDFADVLARTDKLSHEADGSDPSERAKKHDYAPCIVAENIAYEYSSAGFESNDLARRFMESWKKSPGHRKNMLDPDLLEAGMAVAQSKESGKYYAVQVFGRPKSAAIEFSVVNESDAKIEYRLGEENLALEPRFTRTHERCAASELKFAWTPAEGKPGSFQPVQGDRFIVTRKQGKFRVSRQPPAKKRPAHFHDRDETLESWRSGNGFRIVKRSLFQVFLEMVGLGGQAADIAQIRQVNAGTD
jgi:uncharacterized protein YkwD